MAPETGILPGKVLVAGVGNVLRRDDGFGVAVVQQLATNGSMRAEVDVIETGIGGMSIVQQLMNGYQALIVVDAIDCGAQAGTIVVMRPDIPNPHQLTAMEFQSQFSNLHLAEPSRVFTFAKGLGILPNRVWLVACQPGDCDELGETLSPAVRQAVPLAVQRVCELVDDCFENDETSM